MQPRVAGGVVVLGWTRLSLAGFVLLAGACQGTKPDVGGSEEFIRAPRSAGQLRERNGVGDGDAGLAPSLPEAEPSAPVHSRDAGLDPLDLQLDEALADRSEPVVPLTPVAPARPELVRLGRALFFDPLLSGNQDTACASCHHPDHATGDGLSLDVGTGAAGVGQERASGSHPPFGPRHSMALFNLGDPEFTAMFWDGRVERAPEGGWLTPAGEDLLPEVDNLLSAQALFPVLDRSEMRGERGDLDARGAPNELALLADDDPRGAWAALMARLGAVAEYRELFAGAYPERTFEELSFAHATNAIAAFETNAFAFGNSPWDDYLRGDRGAISTSAKLGALLFYTVAGCGNCHTGPLLTDHQYHNTGVPQLGPGKGDSAPLDHGRASVTGDEADRFRFRTPSLRNVALSAPYMHNGVFVDLTGVLRHYGDPTASAARLDVNALLPELQGALHLDEAQVRDQLASLSPQLVTETQLVGLANLKTFLQTLTDPRALDLSALRPERVPSGLPVP